MTMIYMQVARGALRIQDILFLQMLLQRSWPSTRCPCQRSWTLA